MIDDYKIKKASRMYADEVFESRKYDENHLQPHHIAFIEGNAAGFEAGAKWMQEEFLKNLWHPANEKPKRRCNYLLLHYKDKEEECFEADVVDTKALDCYIKGSLVEYINIDDLFPKEGGEQ